MQPDGAYLGLVVLLGMVSAFLAALLFLASVLGPQNRTRTKQEPFECGAVPVGEARERRFNVQFYLVGMLFILFDIEVIFMYPWAVSLHRLGAPAFFAMLSFVLVLAVGLIYVWRKGILDWNRKGYRG